MFRDCAVNNRTFIDIIKIKASVKIFFLWNFPVLLLASRALLYKLALVWTAVPGMLRDSFRFHKIHITRNREM